MFQSLSVCIPGLAPVCVDSNDPDTVKCGFFKRLLSPVPQKNPVLLLKLKLFVREFCRTHVPKVRRLDFEEWLESCGSYNEARKDELRRAHADLRGGRPTKKMCRAIKSFVKSESYPTYKHARMINSRSDHFKVFSGPYFKAIENAVYKIHHFIKHVPVPQRPKAIAAMKRAGMKVFFTDFTAFECHFEADIMDAVECELYRWCLSEYPADSKLICDTLMGVNNMSTRTGVKASVKARRMSGDMCTSLGNGFTNLMLALFIAHEKGGHLDGFVEGDDGVFSSTVPLTVDDYKELGFTIKIIESTDPCRGSFCGMVFADSGEIIRDPYSFLVNFGWSSSFIGCSNETADQLLRAKALSAVYETPQCPVVGALARYALEMTRYTHPRWVNDGYHHPPPDEFPLPEFCPSMDTRVLFEEMYGITVAMQYAIEEKLLRGDLDIVSMLPYSDQIRDASYHFDRFVEAG
jgi:hypothetical protein